MKSAAGAADQVADAHEERRQRRKQHRGAKTFISLPRDCPAVDPPASIAYMMVSRTFVSIRFGQP